MPVPAEFRTYLDLARDHLPLTMLAVGLVFALVVLAGLAKPHPGGLIVQVLFRSYLFWTLGVLFLYRAVAGGAFGPEVVAAVHAPPAPADASAAYASLAFAIIAFLALGRSLGLRIAAVVGPAVYLLAPLVAAPSQQALEVYWPEAVIVLLGAFLLLLQSRVSRPLPVAHPVAERTPMAA